MLVLTEMWYNESSVYNDTLPSGYYIHTANRLGDKHDGGIVIVYKDSLDVKCKWPDSFASYEHTSILINNCTPTLHIIGVYRLPRASRCESFIADFTTLLKVCNT